MSWANALIGAVLGWILLRHPLGAVIGAVLGQWLGPRWPDQIGATPARLLEPLFALAGALAKADGRVSAAEVAATERWMDRLQLDNSRRRQAISAFDGGKQAGFPSEVRARELARCCAQRLDLKLMALGALQQIAAADGAVDPRAADLHARIVAWLEVPDVLWRQAAAQFDAGPAPASSASTADYALLGLTANATDAEVRRRYRQLLARHHPDKLSGPKVTAAERAAAGERTRQLIAAYERIKNARGLV